MKTSHLIAALALFLTIAPPPRTARASQYPLDQARLIIPRPDATKLRRAGIKTTLDLLLRGRTPAERETLAQRSGLPVEKINEWVNLADLMRVRGIGPDVARLLTAVGIRTLADLQRAEAVAAAQTVRDVNGRLRLSQNPPGAESIGYWIDQARRLPVVLE